MSAPNEERTPAETIAAQWEALDPVGRAWNVGGESKEEPAPAPAQEPTAADDAAVLGRLGVDAREAQEFLDDHPGLVEELESSGAIIPNPTTESELAQNAGAIELARMRHSVGDMGRQVVLEKALEVYESGDQEPAKIAETLMRHDATVARQFVERWHAHENEPDELAGPQSADEWLAAKNAQLAILRHTQAQQAQADAEAEQAATAREIAERVETVFRRTDGIVPHVETILGFLEQVGPVGSADDAEAVLGYAVRGVREQEGARARAELKADFEEEQVTLDANWMAGRGHFKYDREARVAELMKEEVRQIDPARLEAPPSREERHAAMRASIGATPHELALGSDQYGNVGRWDVFKGKPPAAAPDPDPAPESPRARAAAAARATLEPDAGEVALERGWNL